VCSGRPFVASGYAVIYYAMTQHQSGLDRFHSCFRRATLGAFPSVSQRWRSASSHRGTYL